MALTLLQSNRLCDCLLDEKGEEGEEEERDNPVTVSVCVVLTSYLIHHSKWCSGRA